MDSELLKKWLKKIKFNESTVSTVLGGLVVIVIGALIVNYFRGVDQTGDEIFDEVAETEGVQYIEEEGRLIPEALPKTHQVQVGETLWSIAEEYYGSGYNWVDIAQANNLNNPDQIETGQEMTVPKTAVIQPMMAETTVFGPAIETEQYEIQKGDHLWGIAVRAYGDGYQWVKIAQANNIDNPDLIEEGNFLNIPR